MNEYLNKKRAALRSAIADARAARAGLDAISAVEYADAIQDLDAVLATLQEREQAVDARLKREGEGRILVPGSDKQ